MVAEALQLALDRADGITVVGRARSRADAVADAREHAPDVVVLDRRLADGDALGVIAELGSGGARGLVLTGDATPAGAAQGAQAGGGGLPLKSAPPRGLGDAGRGGGPRGGGFAPPMPP